MKIKTYLLIDKDKASGQRLLINNETYKTHFYIFDKSSKNKYYRKDRYCA